MKRNLLAVVTTSVLRALRTNASLVLRSPLPSVVTALAMLAAAFGAGHSARAQEVRRFINPAVGDWDEPANWQSSQLPNSTTNVVIDSTGTAQVTSANPQARFVYLGGANGQPGTLEVVSGGRLTALNVLTASESAAGALIVRDGGTIVSGPSAVNGVAGMPGSATVDGAGSLWQGSGSFFVGGPGGGAMNIVNGGEFALVGGLQVGVNTGSSSATVTVDGVGSKASAGLLWMGYLNGQGSLVVQNGGVVSSAESDLAQVGNQNGPSSGSALVTGAGSLWSIANDLRVGVVGAATLEILDGGLVTSGRSSIGATAGSMGSVTVGGTGSRWQTTGRLLIGGNAWTGAAGGAGTLTVQPGGSVTAGDSTVLFAGGALSLAGGMLATDKLQLQGGAFDWTSGTLHVGTASGGPLVNQGGILAPGVAAGVTSIAASYTQQADGILEIELGGVIAGAEYDVVTVGANAALDGQLRLAMLDGFIPAGDATFSVLSASSLSGEFNNAAPGQRVTTTDGAASFVVDYGATSPFDPNQVVLSGFQFAADVDGDGMVDGEDLAAWQMGFGLEGAGRGDGDADADVDVDGADFLAWQRQLGFGEGQGAAAAIPEPAAGWLAAVGALVIARIRNRARWTMRHATQKRCARRRCLLAAMALGALWLDSSPPAQAASVFWTGQGTTPYWNNDDNWSGGILPTNDGSSDLYFGATGGSYASVANIPGSTTYGSLVGSVVAGGEIRGMTFLPAAGAYNINAVDTANGRDGIIMRSGGIVNLSPNPQTFNTRIFHDDRFLSQIDGGAGGLRFNRGFSSLGGGTSGISLLTGSGSIVFEEGAWFNWGSGVPPLVKSGSGTASFRKGVGSPSTALQINGGAVEIGPLASGMSSFGSVSVNANTSLLLSAGAQLYLHYKDVGLEVNSGVANITGQNTTLLAARDILYPEPTLPLLASTIGNGGSSVLNVNAQARAVFDSLTIGASSNGHLSVQNAGHVENGTAVLGRRAGVSGTAQVNGAGSSWSNTGDIVVGEFGTGALEIRGGANVTNFRAHIGFQGGSIGSVLVTDAGSSWTAGGSMFIGNGGGGAIQVLNGATAATAGNAYLGVSTFSTGEATVRGGGSKWTIANTLYVGGNADGPGGPFASTLRVEDGGRVNAGSTTLYNTGVIELANNATLSGPLVSKGGVVRTFGNIDYAHDIALDSGNLSVVNLTNGAVATFGGAVSGPGGLNKTGLGAAATLKLTGHSTYAGPTAINSGALLVDGSITSAATVNSGATLGGSGEVGPVTVMSGGTISPGSSTGVLTTGDVRLHGGANYILDLASDGSGAAGSQWDSLTVNGALDLSALSAASPLNIRLRTLGAGGQPGALEQWTPGVDHTWSNIITTTAGTVGAFDRSLLRLDPSGFAGAMHGSFDMVPNGGNFDLVYDATEIPSGVLVSNLAEPLRYATPIGNNPNPTAPPEGEGQPWYWGAQKFTNDGQSHQLVSIAAKIGGGSSDPAPVVVAELRADSGGVMGDLITTLSAPDLSGDVADRELTPDAAVTLTPGADYWVVLGSQSPGDGTYFWQYANSNFAVGSGTLGNYADSNDSGATWIYRSVDFPYFLQVNVANVAPMADFDGDGVVNGADLARWQISFGATGGALQGEGDADVDGDVDGDDFLAWQRQLGSEVTVAANWAAPEPASLSMAFSSALAMKFRRRVKRRQHTRP
jgi:T5SS/PEP-CTERM-associated repeat protein/autotransporter-associated beta strand protein